VYRAGKGKSLDVLYKQMQMMNTDNTKQGRGTQDKEGRK